MPSDDIDEMLPGYLANILDFVWRVDLSIYFDGITGRVT
jgi:hypothetical protein